MTRYKYVNGVKLAYTAEEEAARDAAEAAPLKMKFVLNKV